MAREGRLPCDVAVFAYTGEEPAAVYRHLDWLQSLGTRPRPGAAGPMAAECLGMCGV